MLATVHRFPTSANILDHDWKLWSVESECDVPIASRLSSGGTDSLMITFGGSLTLRLNASFLHQWSEIAIEREHAAHVARSEAVIAIAEDRLSESKALHRELQASMTTIVAAALAIDALYGEVRKSVVPESTLASWTKNQTARRKRILETLKLGFRIDQNCANFWAESLKWLFERRDLAAHFEARDHPLLEEERHPLISGFPAVERMMYRAEYAEKAVTLLLDIIVRCSMNPTPATADWAASVRKKGDRFEEERMALTTARASNLSAIDDNPRILSPRQF